MVAMKKELAVMLTPCSNGAPGAMNVCFVPKADIQERITNTVLIFK
jgi:hypothetical protein